VVRKTVEIPKIQRPFLHPLDGKEEFREEGTRVWLALDRWTGMYYLAKHREERISGKEKACEKLKM
jgi:hypothetical protein